MAAPSIPYNVNAQQQESIVKYVKNCVETSQVWNLREQFLQRDLEYYREVDRSVDQQRALTANKAGDPRKYQNLIVPIAMPQVESALAYNSGVFLTGYPIFGIAANPSLVDPALQMETVIASNQIQYAWVRHLIMFMRDTLKYNLGALEVTWKKRRIYSLVTDPADLKNPAKKSETYYEGNALKRIDPYNLIWDKRVVPAQCHTDGEFAGYTDLMSRIQLKQLLLDLNPEFTLNGRKAYESGTGGQGWTTSDSWFYIPIINSQSFIQATTFPATNWMNWAVLDGKTQQDINYQDCYEVTTLYGRIIPHDFRLAVPQRNQPQIWKFIIVNRQTVVYVERQTNAHNNLPILIGQAIEDGMGYQTKSFLDNAVPFQYMGSALWNAAIASKRRQVFDRIFYDASRIRKDDIDKASEVARIPVKQSAYGKPIGDAVHVAPYNDTGIADTLQMSGQVSAMADEANGQNKVQRGQFQKGNKTKTEFQDTMSSANSRQQLQALALEHQVFVPLKEIIKINILQYQPNVSLYNNAAKKIVPIKPDDLRQAVLEFKVSDGILPNEKLMSTDILQVFMQTIQTSPLMQAEFDIVGAFVYWCKMQGATWLDEFKRSPADQQQVMNQLSQMEAAGKSPAARPQNAAAPAPQGT